jgi:hypothetical protein
MSLRRRLTLAVAGMAVLLGIAAPAPVSAAPAPGLCPMNAVRGTVPADFALDACVDGTGIWVRNQLQVPVHLKPSGDTGSPVSIRTDAGIAAALTRLRYPDLLVLLPGDVVRVPIGAGAATLTVSDTDAGGFYALAVTLATFIPLGKAKDVYEAIAGWIKDVATDFGTYADCLATNNWIGQLGCFTSFGAALGFDTVKAVALGIAGPLLSVLLDAGTWVAFIGAQVPAIRQILGSDRTLSQSAAATGAGPGPAPAHPCPSAGEFLRQMQRTWTGNHWTSYRITRGPRCVGDWAAADGALDYTERPPGVAAYEWVVLHWAGSGWSLHGGSGSEDPNAMARRGTEACQGPPPAIIAFLGCVSG